MLLSAVSVLVVAQSSSEIPEGHMNNPVLSNITRVLLGHGCTFFSIRNLTLQLFTPVPINFVIAYVHLTFSSKKIFMGRCI